MSLLTALAACGALCCRAAAAERDDREPSVPAAQEADSPTDKSDELRSINRQGTVRIDRDRKRVLLTTQVVLREGTLEMLCCKKQTKEHESILSLDAKAQDVHAALLLLGARTGKPAQPGEPYVAATGQPIEIFVHWQDEDGTDRREPATSWIRHSIHRFWSVDLAELPPGVLIPKNTELRYDRDLKQLSWYGPMTARDKDKFLALSEERKFRQAIEHFFEQGQSRPMRADWVFVGSGFYRDEDTGKEYYLAEDGDLICVANFPSAMIDVAVESSAQGDGLLFEAWTERIPPKGTEVTLELIPDFKKGRDSQRDPD